MRDVSSAADALMDKSDGLSYLVDTRRNAVCAWRNDLYYVRALVTKQTKSNLLPSSFIRTGIRNEQRQDAEPERGSSSARRRS